MRLSLRLRLAAYGVGGVLYLVLIIASAAFVALPALRGVDRSLAPLHDVFSQIAERERHLLVDIALLDSLLRDPAPGALHPRLAIGDRSHRAPPSLLPRYSRELTLEAVARLAVVEDAMAALEAGLSEAVALYELGDTAAARARLARIRQEEDSVQTAFNAAMDVALDTGLGARLAFRRSLGTLALVAAGWVAGAVLLWSLVGLDGARHILQPIAALAAGVRRIAGGDWSRPVPAHQQDELGELARQFNALTETLERRAGQHAQLATAGELLAGVAHELNNPLQAIRGIAELKAAESGSTDWATVLAEARRASKVARELVQFVRPVNRAVRRISVNESVRAAFGLIGFQYRADGIAVEQELDTRVPDVVADPHELSQVIVNLLGNAHAALQRAPAPRQVVIRTWADGGRVYCRVRDNGPGIPPEVGPQIFSPFFSTRESGAGLGLTVSRNMLRGAGGDLVLDPGAGGASFTWWLPAAPAGPAADAPAGPRASGAGSVLRDRVILVADDEASIRGVLERFLEREGVRVLVAGGGREALARARAEPVDAVLLDVRMPDLGGAEVYRALVAEQPDVARRTLFLSGDVTGVAEDLGVPPERVLIKPIELADLRRALVRVVLAAP